MANKEYSPRFKIIQRYGGGICVVTNGLSLSILELLYSRDMNLTEISSVLKTSKTTVQASLSKLEAEKVIESYPDRNDNRSTRYCSSFITLYSSGRVDEWGESDYADTVRNLCEDDAHVHTDAIIFYASKLNDHGICWHPFMLAVGDLVGMELIKRGPNPRDLASLMSETFGVEISDLIIDKELNMSIRSENRSGIELIYLGHAVLGCILHILFKKNGVKYNHMARTFGVNSHEYVFSTILTGPSSRDVSSTDPAAMDWTYHVLEQRFAIFQPEDADSILVENEVMLNIMDALERRPMTMNELSTELETRTVTVNASVKRMAELGLISPASGSGSRNTRFEISANRILMGRVEDARRMPGTLRSFVERFLDGESRFYEMVYEMHYFIVSSSGITYDSILDEVGRDVATEVVRQNPGMTAKEFVDMAPRLYIRNRRKVWIRSYIPVEFMIELEPMMVDFDLETSYFQSLVRTGLRLLTGVDYPVWFIRAQGSDEVRLPKQTFGL